MTTERERNIDTFLATGVAMDGNALNVKEISEGNKVITDPIRQPPVVPDGIEMIIASLYHAVPRYLFLLLGFILGAAGYVAGLGNDFGIRSANPEYTTMAIGAVAGFALIPVFFLALRLAWIAVKMAVGVLIIYMIWKFIVHPMMISGGF